MGRQNWRTPPSVFGLLSERWGPFDFDAAASHENALCEHYNTEADGDPRGTEWGYMTWVNPPFGDIMPWVEKAAANIGRTVMLTPANISSPWFLFATEHASLYLPNRRIQFWHPNEKPGSPDRDTAIWVFGETPHTVRPIVIPEHAKEVKRLWTEANGQLELLRGSLL